MNFLVKVGGIRLPTELIQIVKKRGQHAANISKGLERYWAQIPVQNTDDSTDDGL